jgi:hypothetical protein
MLQPRLVGFICGIGVWTLAVSLVILWGEYLLVDIVVVAPLYVGWNSVKIVFVGGDGFRGQVVFTAQMEKSK